MWMDTKYEPGTVKVVAYNEKGEAVAEKEIRTASKPDHIELVADRTVIDADGKDLSFITVKVVDKDGNLCPDAQNLIKFDVKGKVHTEPVQMGTQYLWNFFICHR